MKQVRLPSGEQVAAVGQGTWHIGDDPTRREEEIVSLRLGIDLGLTLIDTAEMYGEGAAETLVGEAVEGRRDGVFIVSKVYPHNASQQAMRTSCDNSLVRLRTDRIDLYLLHWPGSVPLGETVATFEALKADGKIRHWGVSNFDVSEMHALWATPSGRHAATNQVLYNLAHRGVEWDLLPWQHQHRLPLMAYSPMEEGRLLRHKGLVRFAKQYAMTPAQVALAWLISHEQVIAIPKSSNRARVEENAGALTRQLTMAQLSELDAIFPPPSGPSRLAMI